MSVEQLTMTAAVGLSLLMHFWPAYAAQPSHRKALVMAVLLVIVTGGAFGLSCFVSAAYFSCSEAGAWEAVRLFWVAISANQGAYLLTRDAAAALMARSAKQA